MELEVLLSCMHQSDASIIEKSNLQKVQTLIVNQCNAKKEEITQNGLCRMINTPTRGLSVSRNLAIENAQGDICLVADDDEVFCDDLFETVKAGYEMFPDADLIVFKLENLNKRLGDQPRRLKKLELLRVASVQISFRLSSVRGKIGFDPLLGAGSGNGAGEENKFLLDCHRRGLKIYFVPQNIATLIKGSASTWFSGFNEKYFYQHGQSTRYVLGLFLSVLYGCYTLLTKRGFYSSDISMAKAAKNLFKGIFENKLRRKNG